MSNTYFKRKYIRKYTRVIGGRNEIEVKGMTDLILLKNYLKYIYDVKTVRALWLFLYFVCMVRTRIKKMMEVNRAGRINSQRLEEQPYKEDMLGFLKLR